MDRDTISRHDGGDICSIYDRWPEIARESYEEAPPEYDLDGIEHVVFSGMGGSGTLGDFLSSMLSQSDMHVNVVKGYDLPRTVGPNTLVVCSSVSGNTSETISVLEKASRRPCRTIAFSAGGRMERYCIDNGLAHHTLKSYHSPRASFVSFLYNMLGRLDPLMGTTIGSIDHSIDRLRDIRDCVKSTNLAADNGALDLAGWMTQIPVIYHPGGFRAAANRFKNSLQENAKMHAMTEDVLEASHNGLVAWERATTAQPILLQGPDDNQKTKERWAIFQEYFADMGISYRVVRAGKGPILSKLVELVYTLDYCSIYRALMDGVDPSPVKSIDYIKART